MQKTASLVVYTDLDGTLLDHDTYSWDAARPALARLALLAIPVVLASSKTAQEIKRLQIAMHLEAFPAIVENGAGVLDPNQAEAGAGTDYSAVRRALDSVPKALRQCFQGFGDMSIEELARATGLSHSDAALAKNRQFSEPGLWSGTPNARTDFLAALADAGISAREGGRFLTLSFGATKKDLMDEINGRYAPDATLALGDAPNDVEMLEHADFAVIVANPHRSALPSLQGEADGRIQRTELPGPAGWNAAVHAFLGRWLDRHEGARSIG